MGRLLFAFVMVLLALALTACRQAPDHQMESKAIDTADTAGRSAADNPLLLNWNTDFGVPAFDRVRAEDYLPALRIGIAEQQAEIDTIIGNSEAPTFANTIEALERSGSTLSRVVRVFYAVNGAHANDVTRDTARTVAPARHLQPLRDRAWHEQSAG
jgi:peptidyl-dipeptidase Dcp